MEKKQAYNEEIMVMIEALGQGDTKRGFLLNLISKHTFLEWGNFSSKMYSGQHNGEMIAGYSFHSQLIFFQLRTDSDIKYEKNTGNKMHQNAARLQNFSKKILTQLLSSIHKYFQGLL